MPFNPAPARIQSAPNKTHLVDDRKVSNRSVLRCLHFRISKQTQKLVLRITRYLKVTVKVCLEASLEQQFLMLSFFNHLSRGPPFQLENCCGLLIKNKAINMMQMMLRIFFYSSQFICLSVDPQKPQIENHYFRLSLPFFLPVESVPLLPLAPIDSLGPLFFM